MFQEVPLPLWKLNWLFNMYVFPIHLLVFSASQGYTLIWGEFPNIHTVPNLDLMLLFPSLILWLSSVQLLSRVWLFATPWTTARQASLSITQLPEFTQTHVHWVGDAIQPSLSSIIPFFSCLQSFPASRFSFPISQFFTSGGQSIGVSASASVLPMNIGVDLL